MYAVNPVILSFPAASEYSPSESVPLLRVNPSGSVISDIIPLTSYVLLFVTLSAILISSPSL